MSISSSIKSIQDIMRKDVGVDGDAQRIGQLVWMLFLKIFDDREMEWELLERQLQVAAARAYRWRNWAADPEGMTGDELKSFIDNELFPTPAKPGASTAPRQPPSWCAACSKTPTTT
jgi:type I restriction enzyme M protein